MPHSLIPSRWQVPEVFHRRLGEKAGRQRSMHADGHLLLVLHKAPKAGSEDRQAHLLWRDPAGAWQSSEGGSGLGELQEHVGEFDRATDVLEERFRTAATAGNYFAVLHGTTPLLRAARHLHTVLQQGREAAPEDRHLILARDQANEIERQLELLHADALHGLQYLVAMQAEEQARNSERIVVASHRLNLLMALCLPMTALASVLGMNIRHGLENQGAWAFWLILFAGLVLGAIVMGLVAAPVGSRKPLRSANPASLHGGAKPKR